MAERSYSGCTAAFCHPPAVRRWCEDLLARPIEDTQQVCWCPLQRRYPRRSNRTHHAHPIDLWARTAEGAPTFNAQWGQDWWLYANYLRRRDNRNPGVYVDLATNDPIFRSSTFFLDACLGWKGACIEANPRHYYNIWEHRSCSLVPACATDGQRRLVLRAGPGERDSSQGSASIGEASTARSNASVVHCDSLTHMLQRTGHTHVDVLSLDVEGHEAAVLSGLDFGRITIDIILMEPACTGRGRRPCAKLREANYTLLPRTNILDGVWVRRGLLDAFVGQPTSPFKCRRAETKGSCRGWDYRGDASDYGLRAHSSATTPYSLNE